MVKHNKWYLIYGVVGLLNAKCLEQCLEQSKKYINDHSDGGDNDIIFIIMFTPLPTTGIRVPGPYWKNFWNE